MKKLTAIALVLVMMLTLSCTAFAETHTFVHTFVTDSEGIDLEVVELPELIITIDDQTLTCIYATAEGEEEGTVEVLEVRPADENGAPACVTLQVTLAGGKVIVMYLYEELLVIPDDENDLCYILVNLATLADALGLEQ